MVLIDAYRKAYDRLGGARARDSEGDSGTPQTSWVPLEVTSPVADEQEEVMADEQDCTNKKYL